MPSRRWLVFRQSDGLVIGHFDSIDQARTYRSMLVPGGDVETVLGIKQEIVLPVLRVVNPRNEKNF